MEEEVRFNNYAENVEKRGRYDWYKWKVFVDEEDEILDKIDYVEYLLHQTFPNRRRVINDRKSKFALAGAGWGQFNIVITIGFKDGNKTEQRYFLSFDKSWPEGEDLPAVRYL